MRLGRRQREMLQQIAVHGGAIEVVRTKEDEEVFRALERRGLVGFRVVRRAASLHSVPFDATFLTDDGKRELGEAWRGAG